MALIESPPITDKIDLDDASKPRIGLRDNGRLMTPEEFDAIDPEDVDHDFHYELVHGVLIVSPFAGPMETDPNDQLGFLLRMYDLQHPGVIDKTLYETYIPTCTDRLRADRVIWIGQGRVPKWKSDVPSIAVEFLSAGTRGRQRDYEEKRREYLDLGIQDFWLFDRFQKKLTVFHRRGGVDQEQTISMTEFYTTPLLPGFELNIGQILSKADDWKQAD